MTRLSYDGSLMPGYKEEHGAVIFAGSYIMLAFELFAAIGAVVYLWSSIERFIARIGLCAVVIVIAAMFIGLHILSLRNKYRNYDRDN